MLFVDVHSHNDGIIGNDPVCIFWLFQNKSFTRWSGPVQLWPSRLAVRKVRKMMDDVFANADARLLRNGLNLQDTGDGDQGIFAAEKEHSRSHH